MKSLNKSKYKRICTIDGELTTFRQCCAASKAIAKCRKKQPNQAIHYSQYLKVIVCRSQLLEGFVLKLYYTNFICPLSIKYGLGMIAMSQFGILFILIITKILL